MKWVCALVALSVVTLSGCGSDAEQMAGPDKQIDISGVWDFTDVLVISRQVTVCRDTGSFRFDQTGNTFTGRGGQAGTCRGLIGEYPSGRMLEIVDGQIEDSTISFTLLDVCGCGSGECLDAYFEGTVQADGGIVGRGACSVILDSDWKATPAAPVATMDLGLDSVSMVVGETAIIDPVMYSTSGARLFQRPVKWSTSGSGAVVVRDTLLQAVQFGTERITAEVEGLRDELSVSVRHVEFSAIEAGLSHTCGLDRDGTAFCWGVNDFGQAGPGPSLDRCPGLPCLMAPSIIPAPVEFTSIRPGFQDTCALTADGGVYCWGINDGGQLGIDTSTFLSPVPVSMSGTLSFGSLNVGTSHACGLSTGGVTYCWGFNNRLQLGFDGPDFSFDPVQVSGGLIFKSVITGYEHSCGLDQVGGAHCWGWNYWGQLGVDSLSAASSPQPVSGGFAFESIVSGMEHSCGLTAEGHAYCWGRSGQYQLGHDPGPFNFQITPVAVSGGLTFTALAAGWDHTCGLAPDGTAYCWGRGWAGQLGDGANLERRTPVQVAGGIRFQTISAGWFHTCGLATDGQAYCWGNNTSGQLGSGTPSTNVPTLVLGQPR
ncbi:MAG: hypothetical protein JSW51_12660 [Gemmatimonadota bacterium]|nr:MAG: hypothetical protein JSW51_12660 [Gemmatimonadota bacterium]